MQKSLSSIMCYVVQYIQCFSLEYVDFVIMESLIICTLLINLKVTIDMHMPMWEVSSNDEEILFFWE